MQPKPLTRRQVLGSAAGIAVAVAVPGVALAAPAPRRAHRLEKHLEHAIETAYRLREEQGMDLQAPATAEQTGRMLESLGDRLLVRREGCIVPYVNAFPGGRMRIILQDPAEPGPKELRTLVTFVGYGLCVGPDNGVEAYPEPPEFRTPAAIRHFLREARRVAEDHQLIAGAFRYVWFGEGHPSAV